MSNITLMAVLLFFWLLTVAIVGTLLKREHPEFPMIAAAIVIAVAAVCHGEEKN